MPTAIRLGKPERSHYLRTEELEGAATRKAENVAGAVRTENHVMPSPDRNEGVPRHLYHTWLAAQRDSSEFLYQRTSIRRKAPIGRVHPGNIIKSNS